MFRSLSGATLALSVLIFANAAFAAQEGAIVCQLDTRNGKGWVPPFVAVIINDKGEVTVSDPIILQLNKVPVAGKIAVENDKRITYSWTLDGGRDVKRQYAPKVDYRLTVQKGTQDASVTVVPRNYANTLHGKGKCGRLKQK